MTKQELSNLKLNQRVSIEEIDRYLNKSFKFGFVTKIYNGNYQLQVHFDGESKPRVVGYTRINIVPKPINSIRDYSKFLK